MARLDERLNALSLEKRTLVELLLRRKEVTTTAGFRPPETSAERSLVDIWCDVLGLRNVGVEDSFIALGGDSIRAIQISARARKIGLSFSADQCFKQPTIRRLAASLGTGEGTGAWMPPVKSATGVAPTDLSYGEERLWIEHQIRKDVPVYNTFMAVRLDGAVRLDVLTDAIGALVARHDTLRTQYRSRDGRVQREVVAELRPAIAVLDGDAAAGSSEEARLQQLAALETSQPFDLTVAPLFRCAVVTFSAQPRYLVLTAHHIICDAWSMSILLAEVARIYEARLNGLPSPLTPLPIGYADFARWQREVVASGRLDDQLAYWRSALHDAPTLHGLPLQHARPRVRSYRGQTHFFRLPPDVLSSIDRYAREQSVTRYAACLTAYFLIIHALTGHTDMVVGTPMLGRPFEEAERLIGFFLNTVVSRARVAEGQPVAALTQQVAATAAEALRNQDIPYDEVLRALDVTRDAAHSPLFQLWFVLQAGVSEALHAADLTLAPVDLDRSTAAFDLALSLQEDDGGLNGWIEYNTDIFEPSFIARFAHSYAWMLAAMERTDGKTVDESLADMGAHEAELGRQARGELRQRIKHTRVSEVPSHEQAD
jgi:aryl carrier-like protein